MRISKKAQGEAVSLTKRAARVEGSGQRGSECGDGALEAKQTDSTEGKVRQTDRSCKLKSRGSE